MKKTLLYFTCLIFIFGISIEIQAQNAPGDLDSTFGINGTSMVQVRDIEDFSLGTDIVQTSDGGMLISGTTTSVIEQDLVVIKLDAAGNLDLSFGVFGIVTIDYEWQESLEAILIQDDGKILLGGWRNSDFGDRGMILIRLNSDGGFDSTFAGDGQILMPLGGAADAGFDLAIQSDGKILLAGFGEDIVGATSSNMAVLRFNTDGSPDSTFGTNGMTQIDNGGSESGYTIFVRADGKIILAGRNRSDPGLLLVRLNPDGSLDNGFGTLGIAETIVGPYRDSPTEIKEDSGGKIIIAGQYKNLLSSPAPKYMCIYRFMEDGTLDTAFSGDGYSLLNPGEVDGIARDVEIQADGKYLLIGTLAYFSTVSDQVVARYNSDGSVDSTFGTDGYVITNLGENRNSGSEGLITSDNMLLVCGSMENAGNTVSLTVTKYHLGETVDRDADKPELNNSIKAHYSQRDRTIFFELDMQSTGPCNLSLINIKGQVILSNAFNKVATSGYVSSYQLPESINKGIYFVEITDMDQHKKITKILVD